jgi:spermidine synthase
VRRRLGIVVVVSGATALATEICASRLLAPFFGSSTIVWANIIGLILLYLSVGYWIGGRQADRHPEPRRLGLILVAAAVCIAALPLISRPLLGLAVQEFASLSAGAVAASFVATLLLFAVPVTLLGMVSPFAIRLALADVESAGTTAGRLYALSTMGSLAGTFLPALVTIPAIGTQRTMIGFAAVTAAIAALLLRRRWLLAAAAVAALLFVPTGAVKERPGLIAEAETQYQYAQVIGDADGARRLELNEGLTTHSVWRPGTVLTGGEWDMFLVAPALLDRPAAHVLIIGNAGGTTARAFARYYPGAQIDGVEIDPVVTGLGRTYLGLGDNPRLTVHDADGRTFLETTAQRYDLIIVDAYHQPYVPFHLATAEFFQLCRDHLSAGGLLALNVERIPGDDALTRTIESTVTSVLPDSWRWPALRFNEMVVSVNDDAAGRPGLRRALDPDVAVLGGLFTSQLEAADPSQTPFTDDRAPVEWLTDRSLLQYIASGGDLNEQLLPTHPH